MSTLLPTLKIVVSFSLQISAALGILVRRSAKPEAEIRKILKLLAKSVHKRGQKTDVWDLNWRDSILFM